MSGGQAALGLAADRPAKIAITRNLGRFYGNSRFFGLTGGDLGLPRDPVTKLSGSSRVAWYKLWVLTRTGRADIEIPRLDPKIFSENLWCLYFFHASHLGPRNRRGENSIAWHGSLPDFYRLDKPCDMSGGQAA